MSVIRCNNNKVWLYCVSIGNLPVVDGDDSAIWRGGMDSDARYALHMGGRYGGLHGENGCVGG